MEVDKTIDSNEDEVLKAVKEEYEKKLEEQRLEHERVIKEMESKHIAQIRALLSTGGKSEEKSSNTIDDEEKDMFTDACDKLRKKFIK